MIKVVNVPVHRRTNSSKIKPPKTVILGYLKKEPNKKKVHEWFICSATLSKD